MPTFQPVTKLEMGFTPVAKIDEEGNKIDFERMGYQVLGGMVGGKLASPGVFTTPFGIGLGSSAGGQLYDLKEELLGRKKPDPMIERFLTASEDVMLDVVSPLAISKGIYAAKKLGGSLVGKALPSIFKPQNLSRYKKFGVKPSAASVTQSKGLMAIENALSDWYISAGVFQRHAQFNVDQLRFANEYLAKAYGDILTKEELGVLLKKGAERNLDRLSNVYEKLYNNVSRLVGNKPQTVSSVIELRGKLLKDSKLGPDSGVIKEIDKILGKAQANNGYLTFESLKRHRTKIGNLLKEPALLSTRNMQQADLKRLYGALTAEMEKAAIKAGETPHAAWRAANKYFEISMSKKVPILEEIVKKGYPEDVYNVLMKQSKLGGSRLRLLRRQMKPEEWDAVSATIFGKLGMATPAKQSAAGEMFSLQTFMTNWNRLAPEAKKALWAGTKNHRLYKELDEFASVVGDLRNIDEMANKSKTGSVLMFFSTIQTLGGAVGYASAGGTGVLASLGAMGAAPYYTARLLTNEKFVRWASKGVKIAEADPTAMSTHLGRLMVLREKEDIKEEINWLLSNITQ